jgi:hypothetical protein
MDDTKKAILYPKAASDSKKERYMLELYRTKINLQYKPKNPSERFKIFLDPFMILILQFVIYSLCHNRQKKLRDKENDHRYT